MGAAFSFAQSELTQAWRLVKWTTKYNQISNA